MEEAGRWDGVVFGGREIRITRWVRYATLFCSVSAMWYGWSGAGLHWDGGLQLFRVVGTVVFIWYLFRCSHPSYCGWRAVEWGVWYWWYVLLISYLAG